MTGVVFREPERSTPCVAAPVLDPGQPVLICYRVEGTGILALRVAKELAGRTVTITC